MPNLARIGSNLARIVGKSTTTNDADIGNRDKFGNYFSTDRVSVYSRPLGTRSSYSWQIEAGIWQNPI
jgi:hypothetical protein